MFIETMRGKMYGCGKYVALLSMVVFSLTRDVTSFNFNVGARIVYSAGGKTNNHSYFGYSLVLRGGDRPLIIVGAPRDTSQYMGHSNIKDPGAIYMCNIQTNVANSECQQKILDVEGNTRHNLANGKAFHHRKDNMWLGMTVAGTDMNNGTVVMCAPRWINQYHKEYHLANGLCYSLAQTDASRKPADVLQLIPLVDKYNQGFQITNPEDNREKSNYFYAYGQAGISMKLNEDGSELLLGAPGIYVWTGSVVRYSVVTSNEKLYFMKKNIQNPYYTPELTDTTYFGYSIDSGKYIAGRSDLYVAGAPRGANYKGQVLLFDFPIRENARYIVFATLEGHQFGEYFGSTLASIDINQDGLADLIVGAPMYAQKYSSDQGRVYVYMNHDKANLVEQEVTIGGSLQNGARFGSSIAPIGDINEDGFMDVAIGAPYENNGKGAVYIYLGAKYGLNPNYTQRIAMDDMQGLGISISRGVDIDKNSCKDIAIGAYESAKAVLLRCHPSIDVTSTIEAFPSELSLQSTNFTAKICHRFSGSTPFTNEIRVKLAVDHEYKSASLENLSDATYIVAGSAGNSYCKEVIVLIDPSKNDFSRPIKVEANFELKQNPMFESAFCEKCAVLRPSTKRETSLRVPFATGCGDDLVCQPDLKLKVTLLENNPYVIGSGSVIALNISVENIGEPAFLARAEFTPPSTAPLLRVPQRCHLLDSLLSCDFENPLASYSKSFVIIELDASLLTSYHSAINLSISVSSGGEEVTPEDNIQELNIQLITQAKILVVGEAAGDGYIYINPSLKKTPNITISHTYEVLNEGPTPLDAFQMKYYIPVAYLDEVTNINYPLVNVFEPVDFQNQAPFLCSVQNGKFYEEDTKGHSVEYATDSTESSDAVTESGEATISYTEASTLKSRQELFSEEVFSTDTEVELPSVMDDGKYPSTKALNFSCTDKQRVTCMVVNCVKIGGLPAGGNGAHMVLKMQLNVTNIEAVLKKGSSLLLSTYGVALKPNKVYGSTRSLILGSAPPPASLPIWIYIVATILGIVLLALICYALYRFGFFKRKTKEDLELLKNAEGNNTDPMDDASSHEDQ